MKRQLTEIAQWLHAEGQNMENVMITGASIDSRAIQIGDLFIPFRGEKANGHQFVEQAIEQGAAASLWLEDEPNPPQHLPLLFVKDSELALQQMARQYRDELSCKVIGITGSNGKTSTKDLVSGVLSPYFNVRKTEGNFNNELGLPLTILSLEEETEFAILEMGMSGFGEISFLSTLAKPDYVVITNIGEAHMRDLGSRAGIAKAKFEIIDGLANNGKLFYDGDEPLLKELVKKQPSVNCVSFGNDKNADLSLTAIASRDKGSQFAVSGIINGQFTIPVYGAHQVKNTLAVLLIAHEIGLTEDAIRQALLNTKLTDMRMQPIVVGNGALYINDAYNAAPSSMRAALQFIRETQLRPKKWIVLGDMLELGDDEQRYHEELAVQIEQMDLQGILLYGPRMKWLYDKLQNTLSDRKVVWSENDYAPLRHELAGLGSESLVLLKGSRGMALENMML